MLVAVDRLTVRVVSCEMCGADFGCGGGGGGESGASCWCTAVRVSSERRTKIALKASDCVCPGCLAGYAQRIR